MLNSCFTVWKLFGSHVFLSKRRLTGNRPRSTRRETGRKKITTATPLQKNPDFLIYLLLRALAEVCTL